jgi:hypothetical protein
LDNLSALALKSLAKKLSSLFPGIVEGNIGAPVLAATFETVGYWSKGFSLADCHLHPAASNGETYS